MRKSALHIVSLILLLMPLQASAADKLETLSAYKVTTYNLGALLDYQESQDISLQNYEPLMITSTKADILNDQVVSGDTMKTTADLGASRGFAISAEYTPHPQISVQGAFGMTKNSWDPSVAEHESSWEANLGLVYKLLNNLNYEVHFGYMDTGDLFKERSTYSDVEAIIMVSNKLSMSF